MTNPTVTRLGCQSKKSQLDNKDDQIYIDIAIFTFFALWHDENSKSWFINECRWFTLDNNVEFCFGDVSEIVFAYDLN